MVALPGFEKRRAANYALEILYQTMNSCVNASFRLCAILEHMAFFNWVNSPIDCI